MLTPTEFARMAVVHGSVATVSDPHEIGNVLGVKGVEYMIENGRKSPFKFYFGAPSCVPATVFETAGAEINAADVDYLMAKPEIKYLAEMMNWPGVLFKDELVYEKIKIAQKHNKPVDGHAPGLMGKDAENYINAGISTDHECFTYEEALGKLKLGMKILIREGSAAKNFEALAPLINEYSDLMMFCSDDKHPDSLEENHINALVKRALEKGIDLFKILKVACINPVEHYNLEVGLLKVGDPADFIVIDNPTDFNILQTYLDGELVAENGKSFLKHQTAEHVNQFVENKITAELLIYKAKSATIPVIEVLDGELITNRLELEPVIVGDEIVMDLERDILKIVVVNRYKIAPPAIAFIKNFGLKEGALASSVGHDSHNIIAVGADDASIVKAVNQLMDSKGGLVAVSSSDSKLLSLPIASLMTDRDGYEISAEYTAIDKMVKQMGSTLISPFMSLSFMALLVIPSLKLSDLGLFDGNKFEFVAQ
jgi:adenine deaminase